MLRLEGGEGNGNPMWLEFLRRAFRIESESTSIIDPRITKLAGQ